MAFVVRHGGAAIPLMGQAAYQYGAYKARDRRASRALQRRMQDKSLQAREDSQIRAIEAQQDRDVEMATRRTKELEQQARIGRESAEQQYGLREDFAEKKFEMNREQMEFALEQKKDIYDYEYSERDKRRVQEEDAHLQQINDLEAAGTISPQEAEQFRRQIELRKAGIQPSQKKQWPEGKAVGQSWELGEVGSGMWVGRKADGSVAKLFDARADEAGKAKESAASLSKAVSDWRKIKKDRDKFRQDLTKQAEARQKETGKPITPEERNEINFQARERFAIELKGAEDLVERLGGKTTLEEERAAPSEAAAPLPVEQREAEMGAVFGGGAEGAQVQQRIDAAFEEPSPKATDRAQFDSWYKKVRPELLTMLGQALPLAQAANNPKALALIKQLNEDIGKGLTNPEEIKLAMGLLRDFINQQGQR